MITEASLIANLTLFMLAIFLGFELITKVPATLHTPLMSVTNAISGIIVVGGLLQSGASLFGENGELNLAVLLGAIAILVASINIAGGFLVTQRMLSMFKKEG